MPERIVALLPIKAHSERVKGKNFRDFNGKPLFRWILDSLLSVNQIDQVVINTDARPLLEKSGLPDSERILVRDRRPDICGDHISMNRILEDDIIHISGDVYIMTHATNPLLSAGTIEEALRMYREAGPGVDSLFTVNRVQSRFYREDGSPVNHDPEELLPTQDLEPWYEENSNLYIFTHDSFEKTKSRIGINPIMFVTPLMESFDIDTPDDWRLCQAVSKEKNTTRS